MLAIATKIVKKYKLTLKMDISELGQYTSKFLKNLTNNRKRNQARRCLRDGFKFSSEQMSILIPNQRSGKTKTINLATFDRYQDPISIPQGLKEETIREMAH
ncbi:7204_t:CDS:1 [Dentiscutata heterogama]|uniref:7204_t:CDS:1 n=1 Tax=Dentiscutata heterogama TaxID=1316150 RepID=A0ACA9L7V0_9GLOM|nr:7204_t:CDS:1 [Dentiscutata heterogama]